MDATWIELVQGLDFLQGARPDVVRRLVDGAVERRFSAGDVILEEGAAGREIYLVVKGSVEIVKRQGGGETLLGRRDAGELVGEMAFLDSQPRSATVRAVAPALLLEFSEPGLREALAEQPELLYRTVAGLSVRLRESDQHLIADLRRKNEELARAYRELQVAQAALVEKERLERELELAREIQRRMLPKTFPRLAGFDCAAASRPARQVGGDFYDVISLGSDRVGLVMADVSGKGMPAALFMALTRSLMRAEAQRSVSPKEALLRVNNLLFEMSRTELFVTVLYGVLDLSTSTFCYARAGHERALYHSPLRDECRFLEGEGMFLGMVEPVVVEELCIDLLPGDRIVLFSDGITDANSADGRLFGRQRLAAVIAEPAETTAQGSIDGVFQRVAEFQAGSEQFDDMALLVARLCGSE
ncbi:MAG: SpoIIE family protein phosphatase [Anaerolineae bacterium]|nr:SpoIIE family protein phosphatase [Anaerolineae bacterium]